MRRYPKPRNSKRSFILACILIIALIILSVIINISLRPILFDMASQAGKYAVYNIISDTVDEVFKSRYVDYSEMVTLIYNDYGFVTAVEYDYSTVNRIKLNCTRTLTDKLTKLKSNKLSVPLGSIFADINTQGRGPKLKFRIKQISVPDVKVVSVFESCGINQTKHEIRLIIGASAEIYIPPDKSGFDCKQEYILATTVIVGNIPNGYAVIQ